MISDQRREEIEIIKTILMNELNTDQVTHLTAGRYRVDLSAITCTGSNVTQYFRIPFHHMIDRIEIKHTDSSKADSTDALTYSLKYHRYENLLFTIASGSAITSSDRAHIFNDFIKESAQYQLVTNSTNTDLLYISMYIKKIEVY